MSQLEELRKEIDQIDRQLTALIEQRFRVTGQVGELKKQSGKAVFDPVRGREVIRDRVSRVGDPHIQGAVESLFELMMANSRQNQRLLCRDSIENLLKRLPVCREIQADGETVVAYGGVEGSFGEEALLSFFGERPQRRGFPYFSQVVESVRTGKAGFGVLPIENSSTGAVNEVYDLLRDSGCYIVGEIKLPIRHCLLGLEGTSLEDIQKVYSHPQGLSQSSQFLQQHGNWECVPYLNTAMSAKLVKETGDCSLAAVGSKRCADEYGLEVLAEGINDSLHNHTRFVVISANSLMSDKADKISLCFDLAHTTGSLYQVLTFFSINHINLLKLESRPIPDKNWEYSFFIDIEGNIGQQKIQDAICSVMDETTRFRYLGNYIGG